MFVASVVEKHHALFLGTAYAEYSIQLEAHPQGQYKIREYTDVPSQGATTVTTLGLSDIPLHMFSQELMFLCYKSFLSTDLIKLLAVLAQKVSESNHPLFAGEVLPQAGPILEGIKMEAFYVAPLMYFGSGQQDFTVVKIGELSVLNAWLVPIYKSEAEWIMRNSGDAFEDVIIEQDPDLMDWNRVPMLPSIM